MIKNVFVKGEPKRRESDVYISNDSWIVMDIWWWIYKYKPIGMVWYSN